MVKSLIILSFISVLCGSNIDTRLAEAGLNRSEIEKAIRKAPINQRPAMEWLVKNMPIEDLERLSSEFLLTNSTFAFKAKENFLWSESIPNEIFFDYVLPYASLNERREEWREDFFNRFSPLVEKATSAYEAAALLNNQIYEIVGVQYSTKRPKADQSPYESIAAGLASCTGLSFLLIDACRSVGIPARFVGTPMWHNNSGNHSWVEIWDNGWHFTGAAEPTGKILDEVWFSELAGHAIKGDMKYGIFAVTWSDSKIYFPMDWLPGEKKYRAFDVTDRYTIHYKNNQGLVPIRIRALSSAGLRKAVNVTITGENNYFFEGISKDETCDLNDHLMVMLPKGKTFTVKSNNDIRVLEVEEDCIIDLSAY